MEEKSADRAAEDYISILPLPILQHFLSILEAKDAAQMATFSKAWYAAWNLLPFLNFGDDFFYREGNILSENIPELFDIVNQTLANRKEQNVSIEKFWISIPPWNSYVHYSVRNWIKILVACNIKELILTINTADDFFYILPQEIFSAKGLDILDLRGFRLELPPDGIKFSSLRKLRLSDTYLGEQFIQALCASCIGLEHLSLSSCPGLASLEIAGTLPKLKSVSLFCLPEFEMVYIDAPNLEDVRIDSDYGMVRVIKITCRKSLKFLHIYSLNVTEEWLHDLLFDQPNLEHLYLSGCLNLQRIKIASERLEYLGLQFCKDLIDVELNTPNLRSFNYISGDRFPTVKFMKASVSLEVELSLFPGEILDGHWYSKFMKFLANFKQLKAIDLKCNWDAIVIPKDMRKDSVPPLYGTTDSFHIQFQSFEYFSSFVDVVDSLLWISPQLNTLTFVRYYLELDSTLKFIYEDASAGDEKTFRRRKLKEVKMENFTSMEQQELTNYFLTNEDYIGEEASIV